MDSCEEFLTILDDVASRQGHVSTLIDTLNRAQAQVCVLFLIHFIFLYLFYSRCNLW